MNFQPTALYQFTGDQLLEFAQEIARVALATEQSVIPKPEQISSRQVKIILEQKGFRVKSDTTLTNITHRYGLMRQRIGNEYWYRTDQIEAIPSKARS